MYHTNLYSQPRYVMGTDRYPVDTRHASLKDAIGAGSYDRVSRAFATEGFAVKGEIVASAELVICERNRACNNDIVTGELARLGLRPATLSELLAFGQTYPDVQRQLRLMANGSVCVEPNEGYYVPMLDSQYGRRVLDIDHWPGPWDQHLRFLAVPISAI